MKILIRSFILMVLGMPASVAFACSVPLANSTESQNQVTAESANPISFEFRSGARWELCWSVDKYSGLVISEVHYAGPNRPLRKLLDSASISQILLQYDEDTDASHLVSQFGLGGDHWDERSLNCENGEWVAGAEHTICLKQREVNLLARARHYHSLPRNEVTLNAVSNIGLNTFQQIWRFTEDGELKPAVVHSGIVSRYTTNANYGVKVDDSNRYASNATLLVNWRLDFNIDNTPNNDRVDEFNFTDVNSSDLKKNLTITSIGNESFRKIKNTDFRGWRISDQVLTSGENGHESPTRIGYYLDPQPSGYRLNHPTIAWTKFDLAITDKSLCELHASGNTTSYPECGDQLSEFVNDERIKDPVIWFSLTRRFTPSKEDFPVIRSKSIEFSLLPFDWSANSPFSELATPINQSLEINQ